MELEVVSVIRSGAEPGALFGTVIRLFTVKSMVTAPTWYVPTTVRRY